MTSTAIVDPSLDPTEYVVHSLPCYSELSISLLLYDMRIKYINLHLVLKGGNSHIAYLP